MLNKDISLLEAHKISDKIECKLKKEVSNSKILIHLDPVDDSHFDTCPI